MPVRSHKPRYTSTVRYNNGVLEVFNGTTWIAAPSSTPVAPYLVYTALLNQTGTGAPVATEFTNTLGVTVNWARYVLGYYAGEFSFPLPKNKTFMLIQQSYINNIILIGEESTAGNNLNSVFVTKRTFTNAYAEGLINIAVEIRVYP